MYGYGATSIMRKRFDAVTEWRCDGDTWGEVRFKLGLSDIARNTLSRLWHTELERRSPHRAHAHRWTRNHESELAALRGKGYTWGEILVQVPFDHYPEGVPPMEVIDSAFEWHQRHKLAVFTRCGVSQAQIDEMFSWRDKPPVVAPEPTVADVRTRLEQVSNELTHILADISGSRQEETC